MSFDISKRIRPTWTDPNSANSAKQPLVHEPPGLRPNCCVIVEGVDGFSERDIRNALSVFGMVSSTRLLPPFFSAALVEFSETGPAAKVLEYANNPSDAHLVLICGRQVFARPATLSELQALRGAPSSTSGGSRVLRVAVNKCEYPITTDVIHTICSPYAKVLRIVIQPEDAVEKQTMVLVEVDSADSARRVAESLEGQDIYSDCCTLHIETSNLPSLAGTVVANDDRSFDFTLEAAGASAFAESVAGPPGGYPIGPSGARGPGPYAPYGQPRPMYPYGPGPSAHGSRFPGPYGMSGSSRYPPSVAPPFIQPPPIGGVPAGEESASYGIRGPVMMQMRMPMGPGSAACANPCVMIKGLHGPPAEGGHEHIVTCDLVFNLVCLYGDVVRIKVLISTEGTSMVQMADSYGALCVVSNLNGQLLFGEKLNVFSPDFWEVHPAGPIVPRLADDSPSIVEYAENRFNRFSSSGMAPHKIRIAPPSATVHFYNAPPSVTDEQMFEFFVKNGAPRPAKVIKFAPKSEHASSVGGLAEWASVDEALQAVFLANHCTIDAPNDSPFPYNVKLIFSTVPISEQRAQRTRERVAQQQQQQQQQQRSDASNNGSTANNDGNNANAAESSALGSSDYSASKASRHWKSSRGGNSRGKRKMDTYSGYVNDSRSFFPPQQNNFYDYAAASHYQPFE